MRGPAPQPFRRVALGEVAWRIRQFLECLLSVTDWRWLP
jgi:hypothetical protein